MHTTDPEAFARMFEGSVRRIFVRVFGKPHKIDILKRSILSSYLEKGRELGWTKPDPGAVLVLTEFAWVQDPYKSNADYAGWGRAAELLQKDGWRGAAWDSINPGVQVVFVDYSKQHRLGE